MKGAFLPLLTSLLFSGSYIAGKYTTADLGPLTATLLRYGVALAFLCLLLARVGRSGLVIERSDIGQLVLLGVLGIVGYHFFFFLSLRHTEVANTAIINALSPVMTASLAALLIRERLSAAGYLGVGVAVVGVITLITDARWSELAALGANYGDLMMLLAVGCWTGYALLVKTLVARYPSFTLTFYATLTGVVALLVVTPWFEEVGPQLESISPTSIYAVVYMGIAASGLGYLTFNSSVETIGATRTSSIVYGVVPVFVAVLALLFFREPITMAMIASAGWIVGGLWLVMGPETGSRR